MIQLYDAATGEPCGALTDEQFTVLVEALEEESSEDDDYYLDIPTLEMLEQQGADPDLIATLRAALGDRTEMDLAWEAVEEASADDSNGRR